VHANHSKEPVVIAPPRILGNLRKAFHAEVADPDTAEIPKELRAA
jgi:protein required for attachment to host cells